MRHLHDENEESLKKLRATWMDPVYAISLLCASGRYAHRRSAFALQLINDSFRYLLSEVANLEKKLQQAQADLLVNTFNPQVIVIGGVLAKVHDHLLAGIRETIYRRSLPLATHHLAIVPTRTGADAAATGAGILAIEHFLAPDNINRIVTETESSRTPTSTGG